MKRIGFVGFILGIMALSPACAGVPLQQVPPTGAAIYVKLPDGTFAPAAADSSGNISVNGSFSATLSGFTPNGSVATLAVSAASGNVALPSGTVVAVSNTGSTAASIKLSVGASTAATTDFQIQPGATVGLTVGSNTFINAITASGTTSLSLAGGSGLVTGYGGGGGGGSGGNTNVTQLGGNAINTGNGTAGTGTQRVAIASDSNMPLPTGAATAANQTTGNTSLSTIATNTTGAATAANQTSVQGSKTGGTAATSSELVGGVYNTAAPTLTNGQQAAAQLDVNGNVKVNIVAGAGSGGAAYAQGTTTSGQSVNPAGCATTSSAPTNTTAQTNMLSCQTDGALRVSVTNNGVADATSATGLNYSAVAAKVETSGATVTNGNLGHLSLDTSSNLRVNCVTGCSTVSNATRFTLTAAASTNATNVKASAGGVTHISVYNNSATLAWLSFYNTAGTPTCGTSIVYQTMIPANSTSGAGAVEDFAVPLDFSTGIGICVTTGIAGTGAVSASSYVVNIGYK